MTSARKISYDDYMKLKKRISFFHYDIGKSKHDLAAENGCEWNFIDNMLTNNDQALITRLKEERQ